MKSAIALVMLGAAACAPMPEPIASDTCGAARHATLVGKPITDPAVPAASRLVRHIRPGDAVTEDYVVERLNIHVTGAGLIESLTCG